MMPIQSELAWYPWWLFSPPAVLLSFLAYSAVCVLLTRWIMVRRRVWLMASALLIPAALIAPANWAVEQSREARERATPRRVIAHDAELREGNGEAYPVKARLPRGAVCRRLASRGEWEQLECPDGTIGWLRTDYLKAH